jgi:type IV secretory pathway VirB9-like protein
MSRIIRILILLAIFSGPSYAKILGDVFQEKGETIDYSPSSDSNIGRKRAIDLRDVQEAFSKSSPKENIVRFSWQSSEIFKIKTRLRTKTLILLPEDEEIKAYTIGDTKSFKVSLMGKELPNMLDIQSFYAGVDTSLTIIGKEGRVYSFYIRSYAVKSEFVPDLVVYVDAPPLNPEKSMQFSSELNKEGKSLTKRDLLIKEIIQDNDYLETLADSQEIFLDFKMYGDKEIAPYSVYDDGKWTYFDFRGQGIVESGRLPVLYKVVDKYDAIVNTRYKDGLMIAESINPNWTLKSGDKSVCVKAKSMRKFNKRFDIR